MTRVPRPADHITIRVAARPAPAGVLPAEAASGQPASVQPAPVQPVMTQPVAGQPVMTQPVKSQPVMSQPVMSQPAVPRSDMLQFASQEPAEPQGPLESLYPFLYSGTADLSAVLAQATASTVAKTREIMDLRAEVCARSGGMLACCARGAATRFAAGGRLLAFGNGGSATDAQQLVSLCLYPGGDATPLPAMGLAGDVAVVTSLANDVGMDVIFARQVAALGRPGDIAVGLSTSGNSENLLRAFDEASRRGLMTIGIAGYDGGKMAELDSVDYLFVARSESIHRIQEAQTTIYHILWELIQAELGSPGW